jgi:hypothetical protein
MHVIAACAIIVVTSISTPCIQEPPVPPVIEMLETLPSLPHEPVNEYSTYTELFGEGSLFFALYGKTINDFSEKDIETITNVVDSHGGSIHFAEDEIVLRASDGRQAMYYADGSVAIMDCDGNISSTGWIDINWAVKLSRLEHPIVACVSTSITFAVRYAVDNPLVYDEYCMALQAAGFQYDQFKSDIVFVARNSDLYTVSVSYHQNILTVMLNAPSSV